MNGIVPDASVVLKWYLLDEEFGKQAISLLSGYATGELSIVAPTLLQYEVLNGLLIAQKRGRIEEKKILRAVEGFFDLDIPLKSIAPLYGRIWRYCKRLGVTVYDASYLAVAEHEGLPFITGDLRLYKLVKGAGIKITWIGEVQ